MMSLPSEEPFKPIIFGRSSSHFTRVARIFAEELSVDYSLAVARDLMSQDASDYGENPALRLPALRDRRGSWFGALNVCRELWRESSTRPFVIWPEDLTEPLLANAQELTVQAMSTGVTMIMGKAAGADGNNHQQKMRASLVNSMSWLERNVAEVLRSLPVNRSLSFLEVTLFCLVTHLDFRDVLSIARYTELDAFCRQFATRPSAVATAFRFDA